MKISFLFFVIIITLFFTNNALSQSKKDSLLYYYNLVYDTKESTDLIKASAFYNALKKKSINENDTLSTINTLTIIASIQFKLNSFYESESYAVEAIHLLDNLEERNGHKSIRIGLNNHLGLNYNALHDYRKAIEFYEKNINLGLSSSELITTINNKALALEALGETKLALFELEKAYKQSLLLKDKKQQARALDNLGFTQSKLNIPEGIKNMKLALSIKQDLDYTPGIYTSYNHLAQYYNQIKNLKQAKIYSDKALAIARKINSPKYLENALSTSLKIKNIELLSEYISLKDSLIKAALISENKNASIKYDYKKVEQVAQENELKLQQSELDKEKERSNKIIAFTIALFILLLSLLLFFSLKFNHKKDKIKQAYLKETELSKKVHDELANDMSDLMNLVESEIEINDTKKSLLLDNIEDIYIRTRDISTETGSIDLVNYSESIKHLLMQHNRKDTKVVINNINTIDWHNVADHKKMVIYRALQELMVNMKKHSKAKVVSIVFKENKKKKEIRYTDDGIGITNKEIKLNGLLNVESRIKGIGGSFNFITSKGNGFKATLMFNS